MKAAGKSRSPSMVRSTWNILHEESPTADSPSRPPDGSIAMRKRAGEIRPLLCRDRGAAVRGKRPVRFF
ncbi:hypothetical protein B0D78_03345 [Pyramidobacter sp. C12-8]|nr:hypothetical protein B0D78_03345 [Pyramidobacter sp. C12-8]RKJ75377.1 hypothetical protein D7D26_11745 [Pyramidobacter sp. CG50-2]